MPPQAFFSYKEEKNALSQSNSLRFLLFAQGRLFVYNDGDMRSRYF